MTPKSVVCYYELLYVFSVYQYELQMCGWNVGGIIQKEFWRK
jgi:hypothetical protein